MDGCTKAQKDCFGKAASCLSDAGAKEMAMKSSSIGALAIEQLAKGGAHNAMADMAHDAISRVSKAISCGMGKVGARHSKDTMEHLGKAHGYLTEAGATCDGVKKDDMGGDITMTATNEGLAKALDTERAEKAALVKVLGDIVPMLDRLNKRVEDIATAPLPAQAIARVPLASISKTQDGGIVDIDESQTFSAADMVKALDPNASQQDRAMLAMKAALRQPQQFSHRLGFDRPTT